MEQSAFEEDVVVEYEPEGAAFDETPAFDDAFDDAPAANAAAAAATAVQPVKPGVPWKKVGIGVAVAIAVLYFLTRK